MGNQTDMISLADYPIQQKFSPVERHKFTGFFNKTPLELARSQEYADIIIKFLRKFPSNSQNVKNSPRFITTGSNRHHRGVTSRRVLATTPASTGFSRWTASGNDSACLVWRATSRAGGNHGSDAAPQRSQRNPCHALE